MTLSAGLVLLLAFGGGPRSVAIPFERPKPEDLAPLAEKARAARSAEAGVHLEEDGARVAVLATLGEKRTGGYSIAIRRITLSASTRAGKPSGRSLLTVQVRVTAPGKGDVVTQAFSYPFDVVWIRAARLARAGPPVALRLVDEKGKVLGERMQ